MQAIILAVLSGALLVAGQQTQSFATQSSATQGLNMGVVPAMVRNCASFTEDLCRIAKGCSYCRSKWGSGNCYDDRAVAMLPADVYPCRYFPNPVAPNAVCDKLPQGQCLSTGSCAWCQSAAVGSACYTQTDAQKLPSAIFSCENATGAAAFAPAAFAPVAAAAQLGAPAPGISSISTNPVARPTTDKNATSHPVQHISITQTDTESTTALG